MVVMHGSEFSCHRLSTMARKGHSWTADTDRYQYENSIHAQGGEVLIASAPISESRRYTVMAVMHTVGVACSARGIIARIEYLLGCTSRLTVVM